MDSCIKTGVHQSFISNNPAKVKNEYGEFRSEAQSQSSSNSTGWWKWAVASFAGVGLLLTGGAAGYALGRQHTTNELSRINLSSRAVGNATSCNKYIVNINSDSTPSRCSSYDNNMIENSIKDNPDFLKNLPREEMPLWFKNLVKERNAQDDKIYQTCVDKVRAHVSEIPVVELNSTSFIRHHIILHLADPANLSDYDLGTLAIISHSDKSDLQNDKNAFFFFGFFDGHIVIQSHSAEDIRSTLVRQYPGYLMSRLS